MQRSSSLCRVANLAQHPSWMTQTRGFSHRKRKRELRAPLRKSFPTYEIPPLLLDLDAEGNRFVRQYDETDEVQQREKWARRPQVEALKGRIASFREELEDSDAKLKAVATNVFSPSRLSEVDVLSVALLGPGHQPHDGRSASTGSIQQLLQENGIFDRFTKDRTETLQMMLHRRRIARSQGLDNLSRFTEALRACEDFTQTRRLIAQVSQTVTGCKLISRHGDAIVEALKRIGGPEQHADSMVALLNNLAKSLESKGLGIGEPICRLGLRLSCSTLQIPAASQFLGIGVKEGHFQIHGTDPQLLKNSLTSILDALDQAEDNSVTRTGTRTDLFGLLTGRSVFQDILTPSFRTVIGESDAYEDSRKIYITLLGELGALRLLWHEWHATKRRQSLTGPALEPHLTIYTNAILCFSAHLIAQSTERGLTAARDDYGAATGDYDADSSLDAQAVFNDEALVLHKRWTARPLIRPTSSGSLVDHVDSNFSAEVLAALEDPNPSDAAWKLRVLASDTRTEERANSTMRLQSGQGGGSQESSTRRLQI